MDTACQRHRIERILHTTLRRTGMDEAMQRIAILAQFEGEAPAPSGTPPQTSPRATSRSLEAVSADGSRFAVDRASYANHATFTGEATFTESGTISFGDGDGELDVDTVGEGTLGPSAEPDVLHGAVIWRITEGRGRFQGASGLITSNFLLRPATGEFEERQTAIVFLT
jgi:hypothetical protein